MARLLRKVFVLLTCAAFAQALGLSGAVGEQAASGRISAELLKEKLIFTLGAYDLKLYDEALAKLKEAQWAIEAEMAGAARRLAGGAYFDFPIIDAHEHFRVGADLDQFIKVMDSFNISKAIFLPTGDAPDNKGYTQHMEVLIAASKRYGGRIVPFATVNHNSLDAVMVLERAAKMGAKGLKLMAGHPYFYKEPIDSARMRSIFQVCRKYRLPVIIHIDLPGRPEWKKQFENILADFPDLRIVVAHLASLYYDGGLEELGALFKKYGNLYADLSMGQAFKYYAQNVHWDPDRYRKFIVENSDRLVWGSDRVLAAPAPQGYLQEVISTELSLLTRDYYTGYYNYFPRKPVRGMSLPADALKKILHDNPKRIFGLD